MKKIDHEKLSKRNKVAQRGHEADDLPRIGSHADKIRYFDSKGINNRSKNPSAISTPDKPLPTEIVISDKTRERIEYRIDQKYQKGDLIKHPTLGKGTVLEILDNGKMDVFFRNGRKTLAMNKKAS